MKAGLNSTAIVGASLLAIRGCKIRGCKEHRRNAASWLSSNNQSVIDLLLMTFLETAAFCGRGRAALPQVSRSRQTRETHPVCCTTARRLDDGDLLHQSIYWRAESIGYVPMACCTAISPTRHADACWASLRSAPTYPLHATSSGYIANL